MAMPNNDDMELIPPSAPTGVENTTLHQQTIRQNSPFELFLQHADGTVQPLSTAAAIGIQHDGQDTLLDLANFSGGRLIIRHSAVTATTPPHEAPTPSNSATHQVQKSTEKNVECADFDDMPPTTNNPHLSSSSSPSSACSPSLPPLAPPPTSPDPEITERQLRFQDAIPESDGDSQTSFQETTPESLVLPMDVPDTTTRTPPPPSRRGLRRSLQGGRQASMSVLVHLGDLNSTNNDVQGQTTLHRLCAASSSATNNYPALYQRLQDLMDKFPHMVCQPNDKGQLPLHILGQNSDLIDCIDGRKVATKIALLLMDAHPQAIVTPDHQGYMPYTYLVWKWVEWTLTSQNNNETSAGTSNNNNGSSSMNRGDNRNNNSSTGLLGTTKQSLIQLSSSIQNKAKKNSSGSMRRWGSLGGSILSKNSSNNNTSTDVDRSSTIHRSSNRFPPVMIFEEVEWCFTMLSYAMDFLGGKPLDMEKKLRPRLAYAKQREDRMALAKNIAQIPYLVKTILLLESNQTRSTILECSAVHRVLFCPDIIGSWLSAMIRYRKGTSAQVAVDLLHRISSLDVTHYVGEYRKALPQDVQQFEEAKLEIYKAIEQLGDLLPSLLMCEQQIADKAIGTPVIWFVMNRRIATPFTVGIGITDLKLHVTAILAFRQVTGHSTNDQISFVTFPWMTLNSVILWVGIHHIIRKVCEFAALSRISKKIAKQVLFQPWSILEMAVVIFGMWASIHLNRSNSEQIQRPFVMAVILGFQWFRLLGFLKVINEQLATFILSLSSILADIRFFLVVFCVVILMFGDMFQVVATNSDDIDCSSTDQDAAIEDFCSHESVDSFLRAYAVVVGDFELEQYNRLGGVTVLWFCLSFLGTVVMLNVLIAVVTISYSNSLGASVILFRRARVQFLASHAEMERFIRPSKSKWSQKMNVCSLTYISMICLRWLMLLTFVVTTLWCSLYVLEILLHFLREEEYGLLVPSVLLVIAMAYSLWVVVLFTIATVVEQILPHEGKVWDKLLGTMDKTNETIAKRLSRHLFGINRNDTEAGAVLASRQDALLTRLDRVEGMLEQLLARQEREETEEMTDLNFDNSHT